MVPEREYNKSLRYAQWKGLLNSNWAVLLPTVERLSSWRCHSCDSAKHNSIFMELLSAVLWTMINMQPCFPFCYRNLRTGFKSAEKISASILHEGWSILFCWPMTSEAGAGNTAVEAEPSQQYFVMFCCCAKDGSRGGSLTEWHLIQKYMWSKGLDLNSSVQKKMAPTDTHQCFLNVYADQAVAVSTVKQWVLHFSSGGSDSGSLQLVRIVTSAACRLLFIADENA